MILMHALKAIECEVKNAVIEAFEFAHKHEKEKNDYYLFIGNASYLPDIANGKNNPYIIDYAMDYFNDKPRLDFLMKYVNGNYNYSSFNTSDTPESLAIEMMIYTHIWESTNFLKMLKRLLDLCDGNEYDWKVTIPDGGYKNSKQEFIREGIKDKFKVHSLKIADIIEKSYRSQFRNAFAHSNYLFELNEPEIVFTNYNEKDTYTVQKIEFDEWTKIFCYSFLLNIHLFNYFYEERTKVLEPVSVIGRNKEDVKESVRIRFNRDTGSVSWI